MVTINNKLITTGTALRCCCALDRFYQPVDTDVFDDYIVTQADNARYIKVSNGKKTYKALIEKDWFLCWIDEKWVAFRVKKEVSA